MVDTRLPWGPMCRQDRLFQRDESSVAAPCWAARGAVAATMARRAAKWRKRVKPGMARSS